MEIRARPYCHNLEHVQKGASTVAQNVGFFLGGLWITEVDRTSQTTLHMPFHHKHESVDDRNKKALVSWAHALSGL